VTVGLLRMQIVTAAIKSEAAQEMRLSSLQLQILMDLLARHPVPQSTSLFVDRYAVARPTVSDSIATLAERRLVSKRSDKKDKRVVNVLLTAKGFRRATEMTDWANQLLESVTALPRAYQEALLSALIRIIGDFTARAIIGVDRMCVTCKHFDRNRRLGMPKAHYCKALKIALGDADLRLDCNTYEMGKKALKLLSMR